MHYRILSVLLFSRHKLSIEEHKEKKSNDDFLKNGDRCHLKLGDAK
jgi:hypothetical protein